MTDEELQHLLDLVAKATPGPWHTCNPGCTCRQIVSDEHPIAQVEHGEWGDNYPALKSNSDGSVEPYIESIPYGTIPEEKAEANYQFIALSRTAVPALLAEVARLQAEVQRLREALAFYADQASWQTTYEHMENSGGRYVTSPILRDEGQRAYEALEGK